MPEICRETERNIPIRNGCHFQKQIFFLYVPEFCLQEKKAPWIHPQINLEEKYKLDIEIISLKHRNVRRRMTPSKTHNSSITDFN